MSCIQVVTDVDANPPLQGVALSDLIRIKEEIVITRIPGGMKSGKSSVAITAPLPGGKYVFLEISMANFLNAATILLVRDSQTKN